MTKISSDKVVITCSLTGALTNPKQHPVPVTAEEMATSAKEAYVQARLLCMYIIGTRHHDIERRRHPLCSGTALSAYYPSYQSSTESPYLFGYSLPVS